MARIAIIIAVSEYGAALSKLPACLNDGNAFKDLIDHTGRFDDTVFLHSQSQTSSSSVKRILSDVADRNRSKSVEEIVFFFSGHGDYDGSEFRFLLSDYDSKKKNQTSLSNSELDGIFRPLNPELYIKVVDACNSGISYIKKDNELGEYLKSSDASFRNLYFMFSSQADESSFANSQLSYFTRSILETVKDGEPRVVRYRDVMNAVSDDFSVRGGQIPQFVVQATNTEIFCESSKELTDKLEKYFPLTVPIKAGKTKSLSLIERIEQSGLDYCSPEEADSALENLEKMLQKYSPRGELSDLFYVEIELSDEAINGSSAIGTWLNEAKEDRYFATARSHREEYKTRVPKGSLGSIASLNSLIGGLQNEENTREITQYRTVIDGYELSTEQRYGKAIISMIPKSKALTPVKCFIAPILSRRYLMIFWRFQRYDYKDWTQTVVTNITKWARAETPIKDEKLLSATFEQIIDEFEAYILEPLLDRWPDDINLDNSAQSEPDVGV